MSSGQTTDLPSLTVRSPPPSTTTSHHTDAGRHHRPAGTARESVPHRAWRTQLRPGQGRPARAKGLVPQAADPLSESPRAAQAGVVAAYLGRPRPLRQPAVPLVRFSDLRPQPQPPPAAALHPARHGQPDDTRPIPPAFIYKSHLPFTDFGRDLKF